MAGNSNSGPSVSAAGAGGAYITPTNGGSNNDFPAPIAPAAPDAPRAEARGDSAEDILAALFKGKKNRKEGDVKSYRALTGGRPSIKALQVLNQLYDSPIIKAFIASSKGR